MKLSKSWSYGHIEKGAFKALLWYLKAMKNEYKKKIEKSAKQARKYSLEAGVAGQATGIFRDVSPVPKIIQLKTEIKQFIRSNVRDSYGVLIRMLEQKVNNSDLLISKHSKVPLNALKEIVENILKTDRSYYEFVREVDQQYGMIYQERAHFQKPGESAHPDDEYTHESVKAVLEKIVAEVSS